MCIFCFLYACTLMVHGDGKFGGKVDTSNSDVSDDKN